MGPECLDRYDFPTVQKRLLRAIHRFWMHDMYLVEHAISEWAVSHRLAVYLEQDFACWHVDCEFNRDGDAPKCADTHQESKRPDVVVHRRGSEGPNLLAIEIKKKDSIDPKDLKKIVRYFEELRYRWAVCISLNEDGIVWEWRGHKVPEGPQRFSRADLEGLGHGS